MVRTEWYPVSKKINQHFKYNVFVPTIGPDFQDWLQAETGGRIVYNEACHGAEDTAIEFANDQDLTVFLLKWAD